MSKLDTTGQLYFLKEVESYFKELQAPKSETIVAKQDRNVELTQDHIEAWLEVFYEDRIMMNTCNEAKVRR